MIKRPVKIVVTGPESTGKTELCRELSVVFQTACIPEYARGYIEGLKRPYQYRDVEHIARVQHQELSTVNSRNEKVIFFDTSLVITKVWFREVYGRVPGWLDDALGNAGIGLFLVCYYDLEWEPDPVRENPDPRREYLFHEYLKEIDLLGIPGETIQGFGKTRSLNAMNAILKHFPEFRRP
jgi:nicotinamide riboside kinase